MLARIHLGHTRLTHGHLMNHGVPPSRSNCHCPLTNNHIFLNCPTASKHYSSRFPFLSTLTQSPHIHDFMSANHSSATGHFPMRDTMPPCHVSTCVVFVTVRRSRSAGTWTFKCRQPSSRYPGLERKGFASACYPFRSWLQRHPVIHFGAGECPF